MTRDLFMRPSLWATFVFNLGGAYLLAFPTSALGQLAGLPAEVPLFYRIQLAMFVSVSGGAYAWLARQPRIDRPLVGLAAIAKFAFFAITFVLWLAGEAPGRGVIITCGDLFFAMVFTWWLVSSQRPL
jgi:hypothetical protein